MDLRQLEIFAAVARHRHFRRAAEDLYVTQSAVSQQIRRLEAELGLALLRRTPKGVELTPAGTDLLARADAILADVARARAAMDDHAGALRGGVRVAAATADALRTATALARFGHAHPGVRIALRQGTPDDVLALVARGSVDLGVAALASGPPAGDAVDAVALADEPLVLLVADGDPLAGRTGVRLWDLRERPFVVAEPGTALRDLVMDACAGLGFSPMPLFELGEPTAVRLLVQAGLAVGLAPASWLELPGPEVGVATLAGSAPRYPLWLLARVGARAPVAALLHDHLRRELGASRDES